MSQEEVEAIVRMQWNATHPQDPYVDDYYHQASQAKAENGTPHGRRHFAPSHLREGKATAEPHAFLQVHWECVCNPVCVFVWAVSHNYVSAVSIV
jgi:DNA topoisomerase 2-associated protein PAT1